MSIRVVILNHNKPDNSDRLFNEFSESFEVSLWDSGSDPDKIPMNLTDAFPNIYWTGAMNEIMRRWPYDDAVWMVGCDIELRQSPLRYLRSIENSLPFGCWSPCIEGRAHPFMMVENYAHESLKRVVNVEGMAMAVSGELIRNVKKLVDGSPIGFGQDYWLCHKAREIGLPNYIDGRVVVYHPPEIGYDGDLAHAQMETAFSELYGPDFRRTVFNYSEFYEGNLFMENQVEEQPVDEKPVTIITVDNGWGAAEFQRIVNHFGTDVRKVLMTKGISLMRMPGIEVVDYEETLGTLLEQGTVALFPRVGDANIKEFKMILEAGIPTVVHTNYSSGLISHTENGYVYGDDSWAVGWLRQLISSKEDRDRISVFWGGRKATSERKVKVSVITPTWNRDQKIISRSIDSMRLQTFGDWEQLVCSNGGHEPHVEDLVRSINDERVTYHHVGPVGEGDFGNTARKTMIDQIRGDFVMFLDDDNIVFPNYIERMMAALEEADGVDFAVCRIMHFGPLNITAVGRPPKVLSGIPIRLYHIDPLQVFVRREAMKAIGWDTQNGYVGDGVTLENLGKRYAHVEVPELLGIHV